MITLLAAFLVILALVVAIFKILKGERQKYRPVAIAAIVLVGLAIGQCSTVKHPVYKESLLLISHEPKMLELLGSPIKPGFSMKATYDDTFGRFRYQVIGPKGEGNVYVYAEKVADKWEYKDFQIVIGENTVDLRNFPNKSHKRTE